MALFGKGKKIDEDVVETETIDLTEAPPRQVWGSPGRCPDCGGRGYLDRIDIRERIMFQHCLDCAHNWSVSEAELADA